MRNKPEVYIIIDYTGVRAVQIVGPAETHPKGHDLYFSIQDLVLNFDKEIQKKLKEDKSRHETNTERK